MKKAEIWGVDSEGNRQKQGEIFLDDLGRLTSTEGIGEAILNSFSDDGHRLITKHEPEAFFQSLPIRYRSPYCRVLIPIVTDRGENLLDKNNGPQQTHSNLNDIPEKESMNP